MGLLSKFKRQADTSADAPAPTPPDAVALARRRARRRLIGAAVLLAAGVLGFPLLFETQPRPIAVNIPIEMPSPDKVPPLVISPPTPAPTTAGNAAPEPAPSAVPVPPPELNERADEQGREVPPPRPATAAAPEPRPAPAPALAPAAPETRTAPPAVAGTRPPPSAVVPAPTPPAPAPTPARPSGDGARAQALLEGRPPEPGTAPAASAHPSAAAPAAADARVVVQVGAYTDPDKLRQARARLEQMGIKTYTQVIEVNGERRTRVRVGPFASRAEADQAASRIKAAGLAAAVLTL